MSNPVKGSLESSAQAWYIFEAPCIPAQAVGFWRVGANTFCTAFKDNKEILCWRRDFCLGGCHSSKSQSWQKKVYDSQLVPVTWKVTWAKCVDMLCVGHEGVLRLLAWQLNCGSAQAGERGLDSPVAWKRVCSDVCHPVLGIPVWRVPLKLLHPLFCAALSHTSCLKVEASALLLFPSMFHVKNGKYFIGCWHLDSLAVLICFRRL